MRLDPSFVLCESVRRCVCMFALVHGTPLRDDDRVHRRVGWVPGVYVCVCVLERERVCVFEERETGREAKGFSSGAEREG